MLKVHITKKKNKDSYQFIKKKKCRKIFHAISDKVKLGTDHEMTNK